MKVILSDEDFEIINIDKRQVFFEGDIYKFLFKIFASSLFEELIRDGGRPKNNTIRISTLSYNNVAIVSVGLSLRYDTFYYEGAVNEQGLIVSPFKRGMNFSSGKYSSLNSCVDEQNKRFITHNAIYDFNGEIICSGINDIIAVDKDKGNYILSKMKFDLDDIEEDKVILFNKDNKEIDLGCYTECLSGIGARFECEYIYIFIKKYINEDEYNSFQGISSDDNGDYIVETLLFDDNGKMFFKTTGSIEIYNKYIFINENGNYYDIYTLDCEFLYRLHITKTELDEADKSNLWLDFIAHKEKKKDISNAQKTLYDKLLGRIIKASVVDDNIRKYGYVCFPMIKVPFQYDYVSADYKGYAIVGISGRKGLINDLGYRILEPIYDFLQETKNPNILLSNNGGKLNEYKDIEGGLWGIVKTTGEVICKPCYDEIRVNDEYLIIKKEHKCGLLNANGESILDVIYDDLLFPSEGMIGIKVSQKHLSELGKIDSFLHNDKSLWGYANLNGEIKIVPKFDCVGNFHAERAMYGEENTKYRYKEDDNCLKIYRYGFIDVKGKVIVPAIFSYVRDFDIKKQKAQVMIGEYANYINLNGELLASWTVEKLKPHEMQSDNRHYGEYSGTYAQDVEGWSDEEIGAAFDGEPDAYWNID